MRVITCAILVVCGLCAPAGAKTKEPPVVLPQITRRLKRNHSRLRPDMML